MAESRYFGVGKIGRDQVASYAARKGMPVAEVERWLALNLDYKQRGVGGDDSWWAKPHAQYCLLAKNYSYQFRLRAIAKGDDATKIGKQRFE